MSEIVLPTSFQQFVHLSRYARWNEEKGRRETWQETVDRYVNHMCDKQCPGKIPPEVREEIRSGILNLEVMPSMRCLMTAGEALEKTAIAAYNCCFVAIDDPKVFDEILLILMCGTGVGISVERQFICHLPVIAEKFRRSNTVISVEDSREGWANAFRELISMLYAGCIPSWDTSKVRPAGARLKTFGGRASGPAPLVDLFQFCVGIFKEAAGRKLNSIECHDIACKIGEIVVVGGVRRSALISLSNPSDDRMRYAKSGEWWKTNPHRALANNSACHTEKPGMDVFMREWQALYDSKSGERGIFNREAAKKNCVKYGRRDPNYDFGSNPCNEVILRSASFCNLTEVIARPGDAEETLKRKVRLATIMGTMQATITNFTYLRKIWRQNTEEEALLGVSITGVLDNALLSGAEGKKKLGETLGRLREYAVSVNKEWAAKLGINQATATTCIKPSGCATLDTKIKTGGGIKSFAEIFAMNMVNPIGLRDGMWIQPTTETIVYDENNLPAKVTKFYINGMAEVYEIEDDKGNVYKFTGNHRLKTTNGWRRVDKLTEDDEIIEFI
jgi:ribonucleoside-diphosphate reductase alpha chain